MYVCVSVYITRGVIVIDNIRDNKFIISDNINSSSKHYKVIVIVIGSLKNWGNSNCNIKL